MTDWLGSIHHRNILKSNFSFEEQICPEHAVTHIRGGNVQSEIHYQVLSQSRPEAVRRVVLQMLRTPTAARPGSQAINVEVSVVNHPDQSPHAFNPKLKRLQLIIQIIGENEQKE